MKRHRSRILLVLLSRAALVGGYLTVSAVTARAADSLLSQGRPATASSTGNAGTPHNSNNQIIHVALG